MEIEYPENELCSLSFIMYKINTKLKKNLIIRLYNMKVLEETWRKHFNTSTLTIIFLSKIPKSTNKSQNRQDYIKLRTYRAPMETMNRVKIQYTECLKSSNHNNPPKRPSKVDIWSE
jgi:hypothetical protein